MVMEKVDRIKKVSDGAENTEIIDSAPGEERGR